MKTLLRLAMTLSVACFAQMAWAEEDAEGCKDHPLFNRMPGYSINSCEVREFDSRDFPASGALDAENKPVTVDTVEGVQTYIVYSAPTLSSSLNCNTDNFDHNLALVQILAFDSISEA